MSAAIALLAGMGAGYIDRQDKEKEQALRDAKDKREQDTFDMQMADHQQRQADNQALREVGKAPTYASTESAAIAGAMKPDGTPYYAVSAPDASGKATVTPNFQNETGATPVPYTPATIATQGVNYGGKNYATSQLATAAQQQAKVGVLEAQGNYTGAGQLKAADTTQQVNELTLKKHASDLIKEGMGDALGAAISGQSASDIEDQFNSTGSKKIVKGSLVSTPFEVNDPILGKQRSAKLTGTFEDGTPLEIPDALLMGKHLLGVAKNFDLDTKWAEIDRKTKHDEGMLGVYQQNANTTEQWRADQASNAASRSGNAVDRMSEVDKLTLNNINKQRNMIEQATVKSQADGSYKADDPGAKALTTQLAALTIKERQLYTKYEGSTDAPDPLNMRKPVAGEKKMRTDATGNIGADPAAIQREIAATTADLQKVTDPASRAQLLAHIDEMKRQAGNIASPANLAQAGVPAAAPANTPAAATAAAAARAGIPAGDTAIPMQFLQLANGDPVRARKLMDDYNLQQLGQAIPQRSGFANVRHFMAPR